MTLNIESILDDFCDLEEHRVPYRSQKIKMSRNVL
jgi:hypothetical protein